MNNAHTIELVSDIESFDLVKEELGCFSQAMWVSEGVNPLGRNAIFKCKPTTPNEVFGYYLASELGMPIPRFKGVWLKNSFIHPDGEARCANSMGLLIEKIIPSHEIYLLGAIQKKKKIAAQNLLLRLYLHGGEYPQILSSDSEMFFYDLEYIGPQMGVGNSLDELEGNTQTYIKESKEQGERVLELAREYDILNEFDDVFGDIEPIVHSAKLDDLSVTGYPKAGEMWMAFIKAVKARYFECAKNILEGVQ